MGRNGQNTRIYFGQIDSEGVEDIKGSIRKIKWIYLYFKFLSLYLL